MYNQEFEQWYQLNKNLGEPLNEWNKTTFDLAKNMSQKNLKLLADSLERTAEQLRRLCEVDKPEEFLHVQRDIISENMTATIENTQKLMHNAMQGMEELTKLYGAAATRVKEKVVEKTKKYNEKV